MNKAGNFLLAVMAAVFICFAVSCGKSEEERTADAAAKVRAEQTALSREFEELRKRVFAFMADWRDSQNSGNFETYSSFYGKDFTGIKRAGKERYEFDHDGWLKDRKGMFRRPMKVTLDNMQVKNTGGDIYVELVQTWESATYKDKGPKTIRLYENAGTFKITYEEMIDSVVIKNLDRLSSGVDDFAFLFEGRYLVLDAQPDEEFFSQVSAEGNPELHGVKGDWSTYAYIAESVPEYLIKGNLKPLLSGDITVFNRKGDSEQVFVERLYVLTALIPHFGQMQLWQDEDTPDDEIVAWIRDNAGSAGRYLVLMLAGHAVESPLWASGKSADRIRMYSEKPGSEALLESIKDRPKPEEDQGHSIMLLSGNGLPDYVYEYLGGGNPCGGPYFESSFSMWKITKDGLEEFDTTAGPGFFRAA